MTRQGAGSADHRREISRGNPLFAQLGEGSCRLPVSVVRRGAVALVAVLTRRTALACSSSRSDQPERGPVPACGPGHHLGTVRASAPPRGAVDPQPRHTRRKPKPGMGRVGRDLAVVIGHALYGGRSHRRPYRRASPADADHPPYTRLASHGGHAGVQAIVIIAVCLLQSPRPASSPTP